MIPQSCQVQIHVQIALEAMKNGEENILRFWYWLRNDDREDSGHIQYNEAIDSLIQMGYSKYYAQTIIKKGIAKGFWKLSNDRIWLLGIKKLANRYYKNSTDIVLIEKNDLKKIGKFRCIVYNSTFSRETNKVVDNKMRPMGGKRISRAVLTEISGTSKRTQIRYEKMGDTGVEQTYRAFKKDDPNLPITHKPKFEMDVDGDGESELVWQGPNRYSSSKLDYAGRRNFRFSKRSGCFKDADTHTERKSYDNKRDFYKRIQDGIPQTGLDLLVKVDTASTSGNKIRIYKHVF